MAVPKTTQTRSLYGWQRAGNTGHWRTTQVTPSLHHFFGMQCVSNLSCNITGNSFVQLTKMTKNDVGMGLLV